MKSFENTVLIHWLKSELDALTESADTTLRILQEIEEVVNRYDITVIDTYLMAALSSTYRLGIGSDDTIRLKVPEAFCDGGTRGDEYNKRCDARRAAGLDKVTLIKSIRSVSGKGLKESKELADELFQVGQVSVPVDVLVADSQTKTQARLDCLRGFLTRYANFIVDKPKITS
jgi:hypothetical protein